MADSSRRFSENVAGKYYVDDGCIACDACVLAAPEHFRMDEENGHTYVIRQPASSSEEELCTEALEGCPVEAIGSDGEP